jgi:hypothetical protein
LFPLLKDPQTLSPELTYLVNLESKLVFELIFGLRGLQGLISEFPGFSPVVVVVVLELVLECGGGHVGYWVSVLACTPAVGFSVSCYPIIIDLVPTVGYLGAVTLSFPGVVLRCPMVVCLIGLPLELVELVYTLILVFEPLGFILIPVVLIFNFLLLVYPVSFELEPFRLVFFPCDLVFVCLMLNSVVVTLMVVVVRFGVVWVLVVVIRLRMVCIQLIFVVVAIVFTIVLILPVRVAGNVGVEGWVVTVTVRVWWWE